MRGTVQSNDLPTGRYLVQVVDIEEATGQWGPQLKWNLEIISGDFEGRRLSTYSSTSMTTKSNLVKFASALQGKSPLQMLDEELDTDDLIGLRAVANVIEKEGKNGEMFPKVDSLVPYVPKDPKKAAANAENRIKAQAAAQAAKAKPAPAATATEEAEEENGFDPFAEE